jgi:hypothetical protein
VSERRQQRLERGPEERGDESDHGGERKDHNPLPGECRYRRPGERRRTEKGQREQEPLPPEAIAE